MVRDTQADSVPTGWFFHLVWIAMLFIAGLFCYFTLPKLEVSWKTQGMPTPAWATVLIDTTHFVVHYWYAILIGSAILIWLRRSTSSQPSE
jgi:type II secretory pathway component PulF